MLVLVSPLLRPIYDLNFSFFPLLGVLKGGQLRDGGLFRGVRWVVFADCAGRTLWVRC